MPRSNKTKNVLKMLNMSDGAPPPSAPEPAPAVKPAVAGAPEVIAKKRTRKAITKHLRLSESAQENPALQAPAMAEEKTESTPRAYVRAGAERQIVSLPLLLINEQLGAAVERFNLCACDECLRTITDRARDLMPPLYVRVVNGEDENEVNRLMAERRAEAIRVLARVCVTATNRNFHGK